MINSLEAKIDVELTMAVNYHFVPGEEYAAVGLFTPTQAPGPSYTYPVFTKSDAQEVYPSLIVGDGDEAHDLDWGATEGSGTCKSRAGKVLISGRVQLFGKNKIRQYNSRAHYARRKLMMSIEKEAMTAVNTTNFTTNGAGADWANATTSPLTDFKTARLAVFGRADSVLMSEATLEALMIHPELLERYKYTIGGQLTRDQVLACMLPHTPEAQRRIFISNVEGNVVNGAVASFLGDEVLVFVRGQVGEGEDAPAAARMFYVNTPSMEDAGAFDESNGSMPITIRTLDAVKKSPPYGSIEIEASADIDLKITAADAAYLITNVLP